MSVSVMVNVTFIARKRQLAKALKIVDGHVAV